MEIWVLPLCTRLRVVRYPNSQFMTFKRVQYKTIDDVYLFNMFTINYLVSNIIRYLNSKISTQKHAHRYIAIELWRSLYTFRYPLVSTCYFSSFVQKHLRYIYAAFFHLRVLWIANLWRPYEYITRLRNNWINRNINIIFEISNLYLLTLRRFI